MIAGCFIISATEDYSAAPRVSVTAVQASLGLQTMPDHLQGEALFQYRYDQYILTAGTPSSDIVLFPEIMVGIFDTEGIVDHDYRERWIDQAKMWNCILVPTVLEGNSRTQSSQDRRITTLIVHPSGILGSSSKRYLVPFSESRQYGAGSDYQPIPTPLGKIGLSICFDANGDTIGRLARNRAQIILAPFNDTGFSPAFYQVHRFYTIIQAIEYKIPVIVANESGISQIVDARGRIIDALPIGAAGNIGAEVLLAQSPSIYLRYGSILEIIFLISLLVLRKRTSVLHSSPQ
jgi:apolipoprotein N-acyltransferase